MPRAPETPWSTPTIVPARPERLPEADRPLICICPYPCTEATCLRHLGGCDACAKHGRALFTRAEQRWVEIGKGLPEAEVRALKRLWTGRAGYNGVGARAALPSDIGDKQPQPVAEAC